MIWYRQSKICFIVWYVSKNNVKDCESLLAINQPDHVDIAVNNNNQNGDNILGTDIEDTRDDPPDLNTNSSPNNTYRKEKIRHGREYI